MADLARAAAQFQDVLLISFQYKKKSLI
jgi:hypothetical protein